MTDTLALDELLRNDELTPERQEAYKRVHSLATDLVEELREINSSGPDEFEIGRDCEALRWTAETFLQILEGFLRDTPKFRQTMERALANGKLDSSGLSRHTSGPATAG